MNAEQFRNLPSWVSRSELCRVAGLSPNAIRMRVERGVELSESQQKALDAAVDALTRAGLVKGLVEALEGIIWKLERKEVKGDFCCWATIDIKDASAKQAISALADWKARVEA